MLWRVFRKASPDPPPDAAWWREADRIAGAPGPDSRDAIAALRGSAKPGEDDERQLEMVEALAELVDLAEHASLPVVDTRHRVIGTDVCHLVTPVTRGDSPVAGKLFITADRLVFAAAGVQAWAWHRIRGVDRSDRDLVFTIAGHADGLHVRCNSYPDALIITHMGKRLMPAPGRRD